MLELDGRDELLTNSFATFDGLHNNDTTNGHIHVGDADGRSEVLSSHPLRRSSVSCTVKDIGEIQATLSEDVPDYPGKDVGKLQTTLSEDVSDCPTAIEAPTDTTDDLDTPNHHDIEDILHIVSPGDSLVAIALRYGVSLSALRHANQLWPSDPIHLRTQIIIPRRRTRHAKRKVVSHAISSSTQETEIASSPFASTSSLSSTLLAARETVFSAFPTRISIDSLSSRTSAADEELELENFLKPRLQSRTSEMDYSTTPAALSVELDTLSRSRRSYLPAHDITSLLDHAPPPISCQQLRNLTSDPTIRPFSSDRLQISKHSSPAPVFVPVRISQLEPEPAMELPALKNCR
ncbi:carbohydrate-binding module family 50 protein [Suillus luteus UH-Slu-Lm8-n1]|uniref:Carbohydrate-binding module family 50 protein n=1 Tax=Suillus luteus UH-Slu-Lm8-n1 TaxID=930992 RepID=A0A0C9ZQN8_9AGAM|nr:carbohydrate-binding module family 50 protein [Suillus luteus UH-Slu-Lm8-n1]